MSFNFNLKEFYSQGYCHLGKVIKKEGIKHIGNTLDNIMMGKEEVDYSKMLMQLDSISGKYDEIGVQKKGFKEPTLNYRKIQGLEIHPTFKMISTFRMFKQISELIYGGMDSKLFRMMMMNKPANSGTELPWHQDKFINLSTDPMMTVWIAIDDVTKRRGSMKFIPKSHRNGVLNEDISNGLLTKDQIKNLVLPHDPVDIEMKSGEAIVFHNLLFHSSGINTTKTPRRALSLCYMDSSSKVIKK